MKSLAVGLAVGIFLLGWGCVPSDASSPGTSISIKGLQDGRVRLQRWSQKLVLDLGRDIVGCRGHQYDLTVHEEYDTGVSFGLVDETEKAPYVYVVLVAWAPPNCNIQGRCGAGGWDSTLIWLKLTRDLKLAGKKAFAIDDCFADRSPVNLKEDTDEDNKYFNYIKVENLPWNGDVLQIEYEEGAVEPVAVRRLIYDRRNPEAGLKVLEGSGKHGS